jgi:tetratricopeptide (TPR) repeat protein
MNAIGRVQHHRMQPDAAYPAFDEAASLRHRLVDLAPGNREFVRLLANSLMNLGMIELSLNRMEEARELSEQAQTIRRQLARQLDTDPKLQRDLASGHFTVGRLLYQLGDRDEQREQPELARQQYEAAREQFEHAIGWFEKLRRSNSDDHENDYRFANCYRMLGDTDRKLNRLDDAVGWYRQASQIVDSLVAQNPAVPDYRADQAAVLHNLGELHRVRSDPREALESFQRAVAIQRLLVETHGSNVLYRLDWAKSLRSIAAAQKAKGRPQDAAESLRMSAEQLRELAARFPEDRQFADELEITERDMATNGANGPRQEN